MYGQPMVHTTGLTSSGLAMPVTISGGTFGIFWLLVLGLTMLAVGGTVLLLVPKKER